jgi:Flp pilus assembly protein TadB
MLTRSQSSEIVDALVAAKRSERVAPGKFLWFIRPLPRWFYGQHLDGLSESERRERYNDLLQSTTRDPWLVLASLLVCAAIVVLCLFMSRPPTAVLVAGPAVVVTLLRQYALRRRFKREAKVLAEL